MTLTIWEPSHFLGPIVPLVQGEEKFFPRGHSQVLMWPLGKKLLLTILKEMCQYKVALSIHVYNMMICSYPDGSGLYQDGSVPFHMFKRGHTVLY